VTVLVSFWKLCRIFPDRTFLTWTDCLVCLRDTIPNRPTTRWKLTTLTSYLSTINPESLLSLPRSMRVLLTGQIFSNAMSTLLASGRLSTGTVQVEGGETRGLDEQPGSSVTNPARGRQASYTNHPTIPLHHWTLLQCFQPFDSYLTRYWRAREMHIAS
jgi:hypothetical protein